ncbi:DUF5658 domain-containing protein [Caenorhabditis elegans]|uniref:DUF5658 domain-containing protein n=1 Tax=Caenorhabditis elegans TaxID=6239 RepID=C5VUJ8_CAEEL|nr:DUF5658 domain-containing protein [Caenorhabditis elegans]pir/T31580/ hypothetical protein Y105C5A.w - Caenorhabditis elegans [Caenorhabditis elegans]CAZ65535.1 DUF5658 domain-containing protein [Caenorhabditis elegans]|eukprot:NP_001255879.1 Uncharacterized protein CELE_Y105C5A.1270 [Caenorhabditis elegans]
MTSPPKLGFIFLNMFFTILAFFHSYELLVINLLVLIDNFFLHTKLKETGEKINFDLDKGFLVPFIWSLSFHLLTVFGSMETLSLKIALGYNFIVLGVYSLLSVGLLVEAFQ